MNVTEEKTPAIEAPASVSPSLLTIAYAVYGLQAVGLIIPPFFPVLFIVGAVLNYVKRDDVRGTFLESHFRWQIRTFWFGLLWTILGFLTWILLIGYVIHVVAWIWMVYRVVKGWLDLLDRKPMYRNQPAAPL